MAQNCRGLNCSTEQLQRFGDNGFHKASLLLLLFFLFNYLFHFSQIEPKAVSNMFTAKCWEISV